MPWQPQYIGRTENKKPRDVVKAVSDWNALWNMAITQGNNNSVGVKDLMDRMTTAETNIAAAWEGVLTTGSINDPLMFADKVVTTDKINDGAVITQKLANSAVTIEKLASTVFATSFINSIHQEQFIVTFPTVPAELTNTPYTFTKTLSTACHSILLFVLGTSDSSDAPSTSLLFAGQIPYYTIKWDRLEYSNEGVFYGHEAVSIHGRNVSRRVFPVLQIDGQTLDFTLKYPTTAYPVSFNVAVIGLKKEAI